MKKVTKNYKNFIIHEFDELSSTNSHAFDLAKNKQIFDREVITANTQSAGKGRKGRKWLSEAGNLYFSIVLMPKNTDISQENAPKLSFLAILALKNAILSLKSEKNNKIQLKWPNDLLINKKKSAGILLESAFIGGKCQFLVIGIGLNIKNHPKDVLFESTSLENEGIIAKKDQVLEKFLDEFENLYKSVENLGINKSFQNLRKLWLKEAYKINEELEIKLDNQKIKGIFETIDQDGNLMLRNNKAVKISVGDVL